MKQNTNVMVLPNISSKFVQLFGQSICKIKHIHQNKRMYLQISKYLLHKSNPKSTLPNEKIFIQQKTLAKVVAQQIHTSNTHLRKSIPLFKHEYLRSRAYIRLSLSSPSSSDISSNLTTIEILVLLSWIPASKEFSYSKRTFTA